MASAAATITRILKGELVSVGHLSDVFVLMEHVLGFPFRICLCVTGGNMQSEGILLWEKRINNAEIGHQGKPIELFTLTNLHRTWQISLKKKNSMRLKSLFGDIFLKDDRLKVPHTRQNSSAYRNLQDTTKASAQRQLFEQRFLMLDLVFLYSWMQCNFTFAHTLIRLKMDKLSVHSRA